MTPNLFLALQTASKPHKWFSRKEKPAEINVRPIEHWDSPVPGRYEFVPGDGWYLAVADDPGSLSDDQKGPQRVLYSRVLKRWLLESEYKARSRNEPLPSAPHSRPTSTHAPELMPHDAQQSGNNSRPASVHSWHSHRDDPVGFLRLDDGITWVNDTDFRGKFIEGPYPRFCIDKDTGKLRPMVKGDDPSWRRDSRQARSSLSVESSSNMASRSASVASSKGRATSLQLSPESAAVGRRGSRVEGLKDRPGSPRHNSSRSMLSMIQIANSGASVEGRRDTRRP